MSPRAAAQKPILGSFRRGTRPLNEEIFPRPRWYYGIRRDNIIRAAASYLEIEIVEQILPRTMNSDEFEFSTFDFFFLMIFFSFLTDKMINYIKNYLSNLRSYINQK